MRYRCEVCDHVYDEAVGEPRKGFPANTPWSAVPDDWTCPDCGVREKVDFVAETVTTTHPEDVTRPDHPPSPAAAHTLLHDTIIAAVDDLVRGRGWSATTMSHVATAAGVSRQTVYNEFGSRATLVEAYVRREIETMMTAVTEAVRTNADDAHRAMRIAFELFLQLASDEPLVRIVLADGEDGEPVRLLTGIGQALAGGHVARLIPEVWPQVGPDDAALLADSLVRLAISHALLPTGDPSAVALGVSRLLAPFVDRILGL